MKKYLKTFSKREILSALFSAIMFYSLFFLISLNNFFDPFQILAFLVISLPIITSHRFYFLEHKRRNRFMGRILHDLLIATFLMILGPLFLTIVGQFHQIGFLSNAVVYSLSIISIGEVISTILNKILIKIGWRIW